MTVYPLSILSLLINKLAVIAIRLIYSLFLDQLAMISNGSLPSLSLGIIREYMNLPLILTILARLPIALIELSISPDQLSQGNSVFN